MQSQLMLVFFLLHSHLIPGSLECERLLLSCCRLLKIRCGWFRFSCWTIGDCCALNVAWLMPCMFWFIGEPGCWWWISFILLLWLLLSNRFWARGLRIDELLWISCGKQFKQIDYVRQLINSVCCFAGRINYIVSLHLTWACVKLWWIAESDDVRRQLESGGLR